MSKYLVRKLFLASILLTLVGTGFILQSFKNVKRSVIGNTVADFHLRNTDGKYVSLSDYKEAKGFMVIFTCNHCPFARLYTQRLNELNKKYSDLQVPLIAINSMDSAVYEEETFSLMQEKVKNENFNFPYLHDALQTVGKSFKAEHTPQAFVIWKENNKWIIKYSGAIDDNGAEPDQIKNNFLAEAVDELLQGKSVVHPENISFGCAIYYRK